MNKFVVLTIIFVFAFQSVDLSAQMKRKRAFSDRPVEELFLIGSVAGMSTTQTLEAKNLNVLIQHNFGLVSSGIQDFFGIDGGAAIRLGLDYGITDKLTIGIGRTSVEDNVDLRVLYRVFEQMESGKIPIDLTLKADVGVNTQEQPAFDFTFTERLNYLFSVMAARRINDKLSIQVAPMVSHFNTVIRSQPGVTPLNSHVGVGLGGRYKVNTRNSVSFEFLPVVSEMNPGTVPHFALAYELETGGHVFQMFLMSGRWFTEQHLLTRTTDSFFAGDFRLGFNVNRVFGL